MSAKVRNDGHFEHEPWQAAVKRWEADDWKCYLTKDECVGWFFSRDSLIGCLKHRTKRLTVSSNLKGESCRECGCSFHAVQLISNRSQSVSVITAAQMALQSALCKEWIIIITHNLLFNTCLLLQFLKLYTTVIHKAGSSFFRSVSGTGIASCHAVWKQPSWYFNLVAIVSHIQCLHIVIPTVSYSLGR